MRKLRALLLRLTGFFTRQRRAAEFADELESNLQMHIDDNLRAGMSPEEARYAALRKFGNVTRVKEDAWDLWSFVWLEQLWQDIRFSVRMLAKSPGATAVAVLSLAIAIGPNCALFSVVDRLLLRPWPVPDFKQIYYMNVRTNRPDEWQQTSYTDLLDYQAQAGEVATFIACYNRGGMVNTGGERRLLPMMMVTENFFSVLGARVVAGRTLLEDDAHFSGQPPAVISYALWQRQFGGTPDAVGKTLYVTGQPFTVVGIMPRGFFLNGLSLPTDIWAPFSSVSAAERQSMLRRGHFAVAPIVRLRPGIDRARAEAVLTSVARRIAAQYPTTYNGASVTLEAADEGKAKIAAIVLSLAGLVVLIACTNVIGIRMAQGEARRQELAVRVALGASRGRMVRQLTLESLIVALAAAGLGLVAAHGLLGALPRLLPFGLVSLNFDLHVDARLVAYALALTCVTTLAAALVPFLRASRPELVPALKGDASAGGRPFRLRGGLVIAQIAVSQFLLVGAALLLRSYQQAQWFHPGFDPGRNVLATTLLAPEVGKQVDFNRIEARLRQLPGVLDVSSINALPLSGMAEGQKNDVMVPGVTPKPVTVGWRMVAPDYLTVMGTVILSGRDFDRRDPSGVAAINEAMARQFWGSPDRAIDKSFQMGGHDFRVLAVVEDGKYGELQENPAPFFFVSAPPGKRGEGTLLVETAGAPAAMAGSIRKTIHDADPDAYVANSGTLRQHMQLALFPYRIGAGLAGTIAILAIFLSGVGLYGLIAYNVSRRTHEIGVRLAMGAGRGDVLGLVLREAAVRLAIGGAIGLTVALVAAQVVRKLFFGVSPADPVGLAAAITVVTTVGVFASLTPARRAIKINPMVALRYE